CLASAVWWQCCITRVRLSVAAMQKEREGQQDYAYVAVNSQEPYMPDILQQYNDFMRDEDKKKSPASGITQGDSICTDNKPKLPSASVADAKAKRKRKSTADEHAVPGQLGFTGVDMSITEDEDGELPF
ncbi:MAG: hypothetical protein LUF68_04895, partial [Clostridiales bacterium]|nr:hypothetical protein [Clostridiales bacterium]